tara:strand:- start:29 stop:424 length:396 start_codon:yes stop_codon:yes gene_type:complete
VWFFNEELLSSTFWTFRVSINSIFSPVKHRKELKNYKNLFENISKRGMKTPIILLKNTKENYEEPLKLVKEDLIVEWNPDKEYLAYSGNSRIEIGKELGCDSVDSILVEDMRWAHAAHIALQGSRNDDYIL